MVALVPDPIIPIYGRSDAAEMAADLVGSLWPPPIEPADFTLSEMNGLGAAITRFGYGRDPVGESGLSTVDFSLHVQTLRGLLVNQAARSAPDHATLPATRREALQNSFFIMLAAPPSSPVRQALYRRNAMNGALRPRGLAWFSRRRLKEQFENMAPDVRSAHAQLVLSTQQFLAGPERTPPQAPTP